jgi:voltage-gated potassium channel
VEATPLQNRQEAFDRFSRLVDGPMMVLALAMIPLLLVPLVMRLSPEVEQAFLMADYVIWAAFVIEYGVKLYLSPKRGQFVRRNVPDLVIIVVPFLRPLRLVRSVRLLRLLRLSRVVAFAVEGLAEVRAVLTRRGLSYALLIVVVICFAGAGLVWEFERAVEGSNIKSFTDALWWSATTITTVGYGDRFPTTPAGRGVAVVLMVAGIALFGVLAATIAAYFVEKDAESDHDKVMARLDEVMGRLDSLERVVKEKEPK